MGIAQIISRIFEPLIGFIFLFAVAALRSGVFGWDFVLRMGFFIITMIIPPAILLLWAVKTKRITNWDISLRTQRIRALLVFGVFLFFDYFLIQYVGTPLMKQLFLFFLLIFFGFFLITLRLKISGHMLVAVTFCCFFIYWYGWDWWPILLILPILAWSRLTLKRHTLIEVIAGSLYAFGMFFLARLFHLI